MRKTKLLAVAAGFLAAAGLTTAGNIYVGGTQVGTFDGTGDIRLPGTPLTDSGSDTITCGLNASRDSNSFTGCSCDSGYEYNGSTEVPQDTDCTEVEDTSGGDTGGDTGGGDITCGDTAAGFNQNTSITSFSPFPGEKGTKVKYKIRHNEYLAVKFTAPSQLSKSGSMFFISDTHATAATFTAAISPCPGDFRPANGDGQCRVVGSTVNFYWLVNDGSNKYMCDLQPGQQYYFNLAYGKGTGNSLSETCSSTYCGHLMQWDNNY